MSKKRTMWRGIHDDDYAYIGTERGKIQAWEDGMRTRGKKFEYEWWYFDIITEDNTSLVIIFYTLDPFKQNDSEIPHVSVELTLPNGEILTSEYYETNKEFFFATDKCFIKIGPNTLEGDLKTYVLHYEHDGFKVDLNLEGIVPTWRSETGYAFFNRKKRHYFAWLPAIPKGKAKATVMVKDKEYVIEGIGYHDHNWGNYPAPFLLHHWYWGRANIGEYTVISSYITTRKWYKHQQYVSFILAKDDRHIGTNFDAEVRFIPEDEYQDPITGKPSYRKIAYEAIIDDKRYRITYHNEKTESAFMMTDKVQGGRRTLLKILGFKGSYARYIGKVELECYVGDTLIEHVESNALWEQMYFGKPIKNMEYSLDSIKKNG